MVRVEVVGPQGLLPSVLEFLQARAVLELRTPTTPGVTPLRQGLDGPQDSALDEAVRRVDALAARLPVPAVPGRPEPIPEPGSEEFGKWLGGLEKEASALEARRVALVREREATARLRQLVDALEPLASGLDPSLEPELHGLVLRNDPGTLALLEGEVRRLTGDRCEVKSRPLDAGTTGVLLVVPREAGPAVTSLLVERGVELMPLPARYAGRPVRELAPALAARERLLPGEIARADAARAAFAATAGHALAAARRSAAWTLERRRAAERCGGTRFAFVVSGHMPAERVRALRADAAVELGDRISVFDRPIDPAEWGSVPVVLRNPPAIRPFGRLLALVPLPRYGSVDPTPWLAIFFPLFFGLVLGDAAFGLIGLVLALVARRAGWGGALGRDVATVALWCSASALVFGILFGEAFGELGAHAGLRPLLLDRRHAFLSLLGLALGLGGLHLAVGMALGLRSAWRNRHFREAVARAAKLLLLLAAAAGVLAVVGPVLPRAALVPALSVVGAALVAAVIAEGPLAALDVVLALGNVLSYARLMALGLASVMLAEVANLVASTLQPAVAGVALGVLLHAINFSLGLVSPAIAALRLQYVEFFDKFYDEGGFPFRPFGAPG